MLTSIDKALVALIVPLIINGLALIGIDQAMPVSDAVMNIVTVAVTAGLVWLVPNKS